MIRKVDNKNDQLPGRNQLFVFGLLSAVWVGIVYNPPQRVEFLGQWMQ